MASNIEFAPHQKVRPTRRERERGLLALTGTLKTTPREMNVGYVMAMPKFIRTLKAVEGRIIRNQMCCLNRHSDIVIAIRSGHVITRTKKQACDPTEVRPGDVRRRADVLHPRKIEDDRHAADKHKVGASDDAQEECSLPEFGTAQDHLKEHLRTDGRGGGEGASSRRRAVNARKSATRRSRRVLQRRRLPSSCHVCGTRPTVCHTREHRQRRGDSAGGTSLGSLNFADGSTYQAHSCHSFIAPQTAVKYPFRLLPHNIVSSVGV